ncbi:hypothetical protein LL965_01305 [Xanthomonas cassavae CFBP 4642]|uniref:Uncharacterized protein n=1 Tax=Xanthomonas cassavae CFBP 4642 TaxID=1219375 RepID=A0ABS8H9C8_9XANT|nr:hypothetical protein [Xanthomonas cassavae]MCC4618781.1 hypothetical protein [Xanthomonas cassavae CFBP 4642]
MPTDRAALSAWQRGLSARWLLDLPGTTKDAHGCDSSPIAHAHMSSQHLVGWLIETGVAAVWMQSQTGFVPSLKVQDYNRGCARGPFGHRHYRVAGGPEVLVLMTCSR